MSDDIKKDAQKAKQTADAAKAAKASPGGKMTAEQRAAMLRGGDGAEKAGAHEIGLHTYYKPGNFPANKKGELLDDAGNPTAPEIHCLPIDVKENDGQKTKFKKPFNQILALLLSDTFIINDDEEEVMAPKGTTILLMASAGLERVEAIARNTTHTQEMWLRPLRKRELDSGNSIWDWSVKAAPVLRLRGTEVQLPGDKPAEQLPAN